MISARLPDWQNRLVAYIASLRGKSFDEREFNCGLFVANCVEAMTGIDHAASFRGKRNIAESLVILRRQGYEEHVSYVASLFPEVAPNFASGGDIAVVEGEGNDAIGVVQGDYVYALALDSLVTVPREAIKRAFKV